MESMPALSVPVTVGVDTHLETHVAAVIDQTGRLLGTQGSRPRPAAMSPWSLAERLGPVARVGIEGTGTLGPA